MDLFFALSASEDLVDYPLLYASARQGYVCRALQDVPGREGVVPLLDTIIQHFPPPNRSPCTAIYPAY